MKHILVISHSNRFSPFFRAVRDLGIKLIEVSSTELAAMYESIGAYGAVLCEIELPFPGRLDRLETIKELYPDLPLVALCAYAGEELSREEEKTGPVDFWIFITGDERRDIAAFLKTLRRLIPELQGRVLAAKDLLCIDSKNEKMKEVLTLLDIIKDEPGSVLILGENGTGKEVVARFLHFSGRRHAGQFIAINCAAIPETLLESELFGHERGAFTGATERRLGKFELASHGTVFLDEIGDMPVNTQAKILRVLETGEIERVGGQEKIPVDIRIMAATNKDIMEEIHQGRFREDLYYRINTFRITLPPLRNRPEDILPLANYFLEMHAVVRRVRKKRLSDAAQQCLMTYPWPGNVRELKNAMERAVVLSPGNVVEPKFLPEGMARTKPVLDSPVSDDSQPAAIPKPPLTTLKELERKAILERLSHFENNATRAAKSLGISRTTLFRKMKDYGISRRVTLKVRE